jgi:hypothetical protein
MWSTSAVGLQKAAAIGSRDCATFQTRSLLMAPAFTFHPNTDCRHRAPMRDIYFLDRLDDHDAGIGLPP